MASKNILDKKSSTSLRWEGNRGSGKNMEFRIEELWYWFINYMILSKLMSWRLSFLIYKIRIIIIVPYKIVVELN